MYAPCSSTLLPHRILFFSPRQGSLRVDAKSLQALGVQGLVPATQATEALHLLHTLCPNQPQKYMSPLCPGTPQNAVVEALVADTAEPGPLLTLLRDMAETAHLASFPILLLCACPESATTWQKAGFATVTRPYALQTLAQALSAALSPLRIPLQKKNLPLLPEPRAKEKKTKPIPQTTSDLFTKGMRLLEQQAYTAASKTFHAVLARNPAHADACLGLALTTAIAGQKSDQVYYLLRAAATLLREGQKDKARAVTEQLPKKYRQGNLLAFEATARLARAEYREAALGFLEAGRATQEPLHTLLARACMFTPAPMEHIEQVCLAFTNLGYATIARHLRGRLLAPVKNPPQQGRSWLDAYPLLRDIVVVAGHTAQAWRAS